MQYNSSTNGNVVGFPIDHYSRNSSGNSVECGPNDTKCRFLQRTFSELSTNEEIWRGANKTLSNSYHTSYETLILISIVIAILIITTIVCAVQLYRAPSREDSWIYKALNCCRNQTGNVAVRSNRKKEHQPRGYSRFSIKEYFDNKSYSGNEEHNTETRYQQIDISVESNDHPISNDKETAQAISSDRDSNTSDKEKTELLSSITAADAVKALNSDSKKTMQQQGIV